MIPARLHHAALTVSELAPAEAFFEAAFGYRVEVTEEGMTDIAVMTGKAGLRCDFAQLRGPAGAPVLELICFHPADGTAPTADPAPWRPGAGHVAFRVPEFDTALAEAKRLGAEEIGQPIDWPGGRAAYLRTPGDAFIEIEWLIPEA